MKKSVLALPLVALVAACAGPGPTPKAPDDLTVKSDAVHDARANYRVCAVREGAMFAQSHKDPARDAGIAAVGRCGAALAKLRDAVADENAGKRMADDFANGVAKEVRERTVDEVASLVTKIRSRAQQ